MHRVPCVDDYLKSFTFTELDTSNQISYLSKHEKMFHEICETEDAKRVAKFLRERSETVNVDCYDEYGWSALMRAAYLGRNDVVRTLLSFGATAYVSTVIVKSKEFGDERDRVPNGSGLHAACLCRSLGCDDVVATLLAAGISQTVASGISVGQDWPPLHCACYCKEENERNERVVRSLLNQRDADVTACDRSGITALHLSARLGNARLTKCMLRNISDDSAWMGMTNEVVNARDHMNGSTPLHEASYVLSHSNSLDTRTITLSTRTLFFGAVATDTIES